MFQFLKKDEGKEVVRLKLSSLDCPMCALSIDSALEELDGVMRSETSYAAKRIKVTIEPEKIDEKKVREVLKNMGYECLE